MISKKIFSFITVTALTLFTLLSLNPHIAEGGIVDNGDPGFSKVGDWREASDSDKNSNSYGGDFLWHPPNDTSGEEPATWKAELTDGPGLYEVFVWYPVNSAGTIATNAQFTINHDDISIVKVNQRENGGGWVSLGIYNFADVDGENVTLSYKADSWVIADAVKFAPLDGIVDNGDPGFSVVGNVVGNKWRIRTNVPDYYGENYHIAGTGTGGTGANTATWDAELTDGEGDYEVSVWYPKSDALATNAPFVIKNDLGIWELQLDQSINGGQWVSLGTYPFKDDGTENVTLSDDADSWVIADAVKFGPPDVTPPVITKVQRVETETSAVITWDADELSDSVVEYGTESGVYPDSESDSALVISHSITLTGLTSATTYYYVVKSKDPSGNIATSQEYRFKTDADGIVDNGDIGQFSVATGEWQTWNIDKETLRFYGDDFRYAGKKRADGGGNGDNIVTWNVELTSGPGNYEVYVWYVAKKKYASNAPFTINHHNDESDTVLVDQREKGGEWFSLGIYNFADDGTENVTLSDNADSRVIADAVKFLDKTPPVITITDTPYKDVKHTTVTIFWNTDEPANNSCVNIVGRDPICGDETLVASHSISVTGLEAGTPYYFTVESTDAYGNTGVSDKYSFKTSTLSLEWTGEAGFTNGVNDCKWSCGNPCTVEFRVKYFNELNDPPTKNKIWIDLDNDGYEPEEVFPMESEEGTDIYTYTRDGRNFKGTIKYRFSFSRDDDNDTVIATGEPTADHEYVNDIEDFDEDGIDDFEEGDGDIDGDGILDCEDDDTTVLSVNGGKSVALDISNSSATLSGVRALSDDASVPAGKPNVNFDFGLVGFTINGVSPGSSVPVTITYSESIPDNAEYWKFNNNGQWYSIDFSRSADNKTITLTLTDGGEGDSDNEANGTIVDPGGIGTPSSNNAGAGAISEDGLPDSAGGCFIGAAARR